MSSSSNSRGLVGIIGRPNVGKSTLFNILTGTRKALVKDMPGVTRDAQIQRAFWGPNEFDVMDTGGLTDAPDLFSKLIKKQVLSLFGRADLLAVVVDGRVGLCPEDKDLVRLVHTVRKPWVLVVNKVDREEDESAAFADFAELNPDFVVTTAFEKRRGVDELLDWIVANLPTEKKREDRGLTLAVVGKPNAGKSSIVNRLLGEDRVMVSEVAGTTVDAVEAPFERDGKRYTLVDTAGLRRRSRQKGMEALGAMKSVSAIGKADVVLLIVDGEQGPSTQDSRVLQEILNAHKGVIVVANKSDLGTKKYEKYRKWFREKMDREFHFFDDANVVFVSAKTGAGFKDLFKMINETWEKLNIRIPTGELNDFFFEAIRGAPAPGQGTKSVAFYYLTQTKQVPPSFIAFANWPESVNPSYRRFVTKQMKTQWQLKGIPLRLFVMKRGNKISGEKTER